MNRDPLPRLLELGWEAPITLTALAGGGNNRITLCRDVAGRVGVIKHYQQAERREREAAFCRALAGRGRLPRVLAEWPDLQQLLLEHLPGRPLQSADVNSARVEEAAGFVVGLNRSPRPELGSAAEAAFSDREHYRLAEQRVQRLSSLKLPFVDELGARLREIEPALWRETPLDAANRCLSPSDFGFHNALLQPDSSLAFVDFEFAGCDDPAKLVCDFACQPRLPVTPVQARLFLNVLGTAPWADPDLFSRCRRLLPLFVLRWCCIMLNPLLRSGQQRSEFLGDSPVVQEDVLQRARAYFTERQADWFSS